MRAIFTIILLGVILNISAQNIGIANTSPTEKLSINVNLLVTAAYIKSNSNPNAQHTHSIVAGRADSAVRITDSVYRILDPGGNGNYAPNIPYSAIGVLDTTGASTNAYTGALEVTLETINLGTVDSGSRQISYFSIHFV